MTSGALWGRLCNAALLLAISLLVACSSLPDSEKIPLDKTGHKIYFVYREWHTSILLPAELVRNHSRFMAQDAQGQNYVRVGWGDGDYFTGKSKSFTTATRALFASQYSALQVLTYPQNPFTEIPVETRVPLVISNEGLQELITYIDNSFALTQVQQLIPLKAYGVGIGSFYRAKEDYSLFSNCNTWSGRALQSAGLPVRSRLRLTAQSVFEQARAISRYQEQQGLLQSGE